MIRKFFLGIVLVFCGAAQISGCAPAALPATATPATDAQTAIPTTVPTLTLTNTPLPSPTAEPTATSTPTSTPTVTPTPTPALPQAMSTPMPDGLRVISVDNVTKTREIAYWGSPAIRAFQTSTDGKLGFLATTAGVVVFDLESNQILGKFEPVIRSSANSFSITSTGNRFAVLTSLAVEVWDISDGLIFKLPIQARGSIEKEYYSSAKISPNGKILVIRDCEDPTEFWATKITLYEVESGHKIDSQPNLGYVEKFDFSPDGNWFVAWERERSGSLWRTVDWSRERDIAINPGQTVAGFSPDGKIIAFQDDNLVLFYQIEGWKLIRQINMFVQNAQYNSQVVFSSDGALVGIRGTNEFTVWSLDTGDQLGEYQKLENPWKVLNEGIPTQLQIPEQIIGTSQIARRAGFLAGGTWQRLVDQTLFWSQTFYKYLNFPETERYYVACTIPLGSASNCQEHSGALYAHKDGNFYTLQEASQVGVYDIVPAFVENGASIGSLKQDGLLKWISSDNRYGLITHGWITYGFKSEFWDFSEGRLIKQWAGSVSFYDVSPDGRFLALAIRQICGQRECGENLIVYDIETDSILRNQAPPKLNSDFKALKFSPNGDLFYSILEYTDNPFVQFFVFNPVTQEHKDSGFSINVDDYYFDTMTFTPDGKLLALGMPDGMIRIFDATTYNEITSWQAHHGMITYIEFTLDGKLIISDSYDNYVSGDGFIRAWGVWP
jgi:WD40 repeat protein